jgi:metal-responsive CopG/Arc/MetJ family transcriptional regulator
MKAIQITVDEQLLKDLDADEEVQRHGRSAVMRRAVFDYLRKRRRKKIAEAYRRAYGARRAADVDWIGWTAGDAWPDE